MQDQYNGQAGTFIVDPEKGERVPIEQWRAEQEEKAAAAKPKTQKNEQPEAK
ncbi:hypothetical protein [Methylomicrobium sp. Wu6]|uniref:hypothetical protein n=1 Tax=Methylomicrobium sp. Wu6 TaxID=3107928 RepID=UPI002DD65BFC|nr:hypothetical protein [Methylomicrobium sp. Wu6]MEC4750049.1 hypothetical protein [Methylomicrobium sp. Wu6]